MYHHTLFRKFLDVAEPNMPDEYKIRWTELQRVMSEILEEKVDEQ